MQNQQLSNAMRTTYTILRQIATLLPRKLVKDARPTESSGTVRPIEPSAYACHSAALEVGVAVGLRPLDASDSRRLRPAQRPRDNQEKGGSDLAVRFCLQSLSGYDTICCVF